MCHSSHLIHQRHHITRLTRHSNHPPRPKAMVNCRKRKRDDAESCKAGTETVHRSAVKRHLLTEAYATVLTLREYALHRLPSSSRLRRKKLKLLGRGENATNAERKISYFLDSTLICSCNAVTVCQGKDATLEQWLSFSQNGDDSRVTISGGTPTAEHTQAEVILASFSLFCLTRLCKLITYKPP